MIAHPRCCGGACRIYLRYYVVLFIIIFLFYFIFWGVWGGGGVWVGGWGGGGWGGGWGVGGGDWPKVNFILAIKVKNCNCIMPSFNNRVNVIEVIKSRDHLECFTVLTVSVSILCMYSIPKIHHRFIRKPLHVYWSRQPRVLLRLRSCCSKLCNYVCVGLQMIHIPFTYCLWVKAFKSHLIGSVINESQFRAMPKILTCVTFY